MRSRWLAIVLLLLLCVAPACTTRNPDRGAYTRDGVAYGVTGGSFRGRWWNYYERGRSYADGGYWAEAAADFRAALAQRDVDQRWARTYGLHFVNDYFPNRELGIAEFHLGNTNTAIERLETSFDQARSARAAWYLDEARETDVSLRDGDKTPPVLRVSVLGDGGSVAALETQLHITASDDTFVRKLFVNGEPLPLDVSVSAIKRTKSVRLEPGDNEFTIEAEDMAGQRTAERVNVVGDHDGPAVRFDGPIAVPGMVTGVAMDDAGVAEVRVGMFDAVVTPEGAGRARFRVDVTAVDAKTPLKFSAADALGNRTEGPLAPDTLLLSQNSNGLMLASAQSADFGNGLRMTRTTERTVAITRIAQSAPSSRIEFSNLAEGQRYLQEEIIADLHIISTEDIAAVELNGFPITGVLTDAGEQRISRRIPLDALGAHTLTARLRDVSGHEWQTEVTIERVPAAIDTPEHRLSLALLGHVWEGVNPGLAEETQYITGELSRVLFEDGRFDLISREALPDVLAERELAAALGNGPRPETVVPAEIMVAGRVHRGPDTLEIVLQAVDPQTAQIVAYADVAGPATTRAELAGLVADLALRLEQEFPRVNGSVLRAGNARRIQTTLAESDRVRRDMRCIVYRKGPPVIHPQTGANLGTPTEILAEGTLDEVARQFSTLRLSEESKTPIEVSDLVVTK